MLPDLQTYGWNTATFRGPSYAILDALLCVHAPKTYCLVAQGDLYVLIQKFQREVFKRCFEILSDSCNETYQRANITCNDSTRKLPEAALVLNCLKLRPPAAFRDHAIDVRTPLGRRVEGEKGQRCGAERLDRSLRQDGFVPKLVKTINRIGNNAKRFEF